jgi:hypothetical protein
MGFVLRAVVSLVMDNFLGFFLANHREARVRNPLVIERMVPNLESSTIPSASSLRLLVIFEILMLNPDVRAYFTFAETCIRKGVFFSLGRLVVLD